MRRTTLLVGAVAVSALLAVGVAGLLVLRDDGPREPRAARPDPVLLVHGFDGSAASWLVMRDRLRRAGYRASEVAAVSYDSVGSNVAAAEVIADAARRLRHRTGASRIDIVSHSMGAIGSRYYVERLDGARFVDAWVSLGGTNGGTYMAVSCVLAESCREMLPGSPVLDALTPRVSNDGPVRFATWWSPCDQALIPRVAAKLPGARNTETACIDHSALKTDGTVFGEVLRFVRAHHRA